MGKSLVIVESPTKARTIARFLEQDCLVESSIGHIRDLPDSAKDIPSKYKKAPWARLGIELENDFKPLYVVSAEKKPQVDKLKKLLKGVDTLYLATDEDREGEAISWHLLEVLQPSVPALRLVFHEITKSAIERALQSPREIDQRLVNAQEARRLLDRLYGYELSPLLWRKIAPSLSAGRVQSVTVRMIVQRERERMAFKSAAYWDITGSFKGLDDKTTPFSAQLLSVDGRRLAQGRDFSPDTGCLQEGKEELLLLKENSALALLERLDKATWQVTKAEEKPFTTQPPPPFITSTLQQEANRKLSLSSRDTMRVAQSLYEQGYITYMRTDSITLSEQALQAARSQITERYGAEFLHGKVRVFTSKVKNAQEAHEAIRPAGERFTLPEALPNTLTPPEKRLYDMIWKRTIACQMAAAEGKRLLVQVNGDGALFQATGRHLDFAGYLRAYVEGSDDPRGELEDQEKSLPDLAEGDALNASDFQPKAHATQPPARYSEAALIKELEKQGIGRPSTYASIIDTIQRRNYVFKRGTALVPTFTGIAVVQLLEQHFSQLVDPQFTARMEDTLDAISRGERESLPYLKEFYYGKTEVPGLQQLLQAEIDPRAACTITTGAQQEDTPAISVRIGRFGAYLEQGSQRVPLLEGIAPDELTPQRARELMEQGKEKHLGEDPQSGLAVYLKSGRYGPYLQLGETGEKPKMKSLLPDQNLADITLSDALPVLRLPRSLGTDPEQGEEILVDLGRYGPYIKRGKDTRSLNDAQQLFSITLPQAQELFRQEKPGRRPTATSLKTLGTSETLAAELVVLNGRYGPYVTDGKTNASIPRTQDPQQITLEEAETLLQERIAKGPAPKRKKPRSTKTTAKRTKKTTSKKAAS